MRELSSNYNLIDDQADANGIGCLWMEMPCAHRSSICVNYANWNKIYVVDKKCGWLVQNKKSSDKLPKRFMKFNLTPSIRSIESLFSCVSFFLLWCHCNFFPFAWLLVLCEWDCFFFFSSVRQWSKDECKYYICFLSTFSIAFFFFNNHFKQSKCSLLWLFFLCTHNCIE